MSDKEKIIAPEEIAEMLGEEDPRRAAYFCGYELFKRVYQVQARIINRTGEACCVCLFTVTSSDGSLPDDLFMDFFRESIRENLRASDVVTRSGPTQFMTLLRGSDVASAEMVCNRLIDTFEKAHPDADVKADFLICPMQATVFK